MAVDIFRRYRFALLLVGVYLPGSVRWSWLRAFLNVYWALVGLWCMFSIGVTSILTWAVLLVVGGLSYIHDNFLSRIIGFAAAISVTGAVTKLVVLKRQSHSIKYLMEVLSSLQDTTSLDETVRKVSLFYELSVILIIVTHNVHIVYEGEKRRSTPYWTEKIDGPLHLVLPDYCLGLFATIITLTSNAYTDILFLQLSSQISHRLYLLGERLAAIRSHHGPHFLSRCIDQHNEILRLTKLFNEVFSPVILVQLVYSFTTTCLTLFGFSQAESFGLALAELAPQFCALFTELFLYCWGGEMITENFSKLHHAAYNNGWYEGTKQMQSMLALIQEFSVRPVLITTISIFHMNFHTYETICRETYSCYTLLHQLFNQKK